MTTSPGPNRTDHTPALGVLRSRFGPDPLCHVEHLPARAGVATDWPDWVPTELLSALRDRGIERLWAHQALAADIAYGAENVVISTGTASGKSLGYQLPILAALTNDPQACALYLAPTKALAADQLESWQSLPVSDIRPAPYDGDTPRADRDWARQHGRVILTNPDMLHRGILPHHERWARVLRRLAFVVVDECHSYRGVFGSHVALVVRRLRRLAAMYGSDPTFVLASATVADPGASAQMLIDAPVRAVTDDAAPHSGADFVLWDAAAPHHGSSDTPPPGTPVSDTSPDVRGLKTHFGGDLGGNSRLQPANIGAGTTAARITATLVAAGIRTLTFVRSRAGTEHAAVVARDLLTQTNPSLIETVQSYRGGYLPEDRRELERRFESGELMALTSTNALELGVDISGVDAAVLAGYPGSLASLWQQAGRAGRGENPALAVFVARDDPLDSYLLHHPETVFGAPIERVVIDPANATVLAPHLACAAAEYRLTDDDLELFGGDAARGALDELIAARHLRRRPNGYYWTGRDSPAGDIDLRGAGTDVALVEADTGRLLGTESATRAPARAHPGAVYLHQGRTFVVSDLDLDEGVALLAAKSPGWWTSPRSVSHIEILDINDTATLPGGVTLATGEVRVTEQVTGYARRRHDGTLIDSPELDMPEQELDTIAVWYTIGDNALAAAGLTPARIPGALHAAEHAAIGLLPLFAGCDRIDIGGLSTARHVDTDEATVFVYDGLPGGAGFAARGHAVMLGWLTAVRDAVRACPCEAGCPSCIQSPKCGNGNEPLDKAGAEIVLGVVIPALTLPPCATKNAP